MPEANSWKGELGGLGALVRSAARRPGAKKKTVWAIQNPRPAPSKKGKTFYLTRASQTKVLAYAEAVCHSMEQAGLGNRFLDPKDPIGTLRKLIPGFGN